MKCIERIAEQARLADGAARVRAVYIGLSYCLAVLDDGRAGLGYVFKDELLAGCNISLPKRPLAGSFATELLDFAGTSLLGNSIALAVSNAIFQQEVKADTKGDFIDHFQIAPGTKVGMVGHFGPLEPILRARGADLYIFDLHPEPFSSVIDAKEIPNILPDCQVALVTATSIINETADELFLHARNCNHVAMIGPSTPLVASCYEGTPVNCAGGALVRDLEKMTEAVMEAGGMRVFSPLLDKVNVKFEDVLA